MADGFELGGEELTTLVKILDVVGVKVNEVEGGSEKDEGEVGVLDELGQKLEAVAENNDGNAEHGIGIPEVVVSDKQDESGDNDQYEALDEMGRQVFSSDGVDK